MNHQQLLEQFFEERPWLVVDANRSFLLSAAGSPVTLQGLRQAADRLGNQLVTAPHFDLAWREFIARRPEFNMLANRSICFSSLNPYEEPSAEVFCKLADRENSPLAVNATTTARRDEAREREQDIAELTANGTRHVTVLNAQGKRFELDEEGREVGFSSSGGPKVRGNGFVDMTNQQIAELASTVREQRRMQNLSPAELKATINADRQQKFEASTASVRPAPAHYRLENPDTGEEFTDKRSLIRFLNSNKENARRLLTFSDGRSRKGAAARLEEILRGTV